MDTIIETMADFANWLLGLSDYITSAISAFFEALWIFLQDWMVFGLEAGLISAGAKMAGIDVSIPTPAEIMLYLPEQMQQIIFRIGIPEAFSYMSAAVTIRFGIFGARVASWLKAW